MDTRPSYTTIDTHYAGTGKIPAGTSLPLQITGRTGSGIPSGEVLAAVALNVTPVDPTGVGYMTVWSGNGPAPLAANLNLSPGKTIPNLVISQVDGSGQVSIYNGGVAAVDVVVDAQGYFPISTSYVSMTPARLLDTRPGHHTVDENDAAIGAISSASQLDLPVLTRAGIPASGVDTLIFNLTAVLPSNVGYVTAWSGDDALPTAANLNLNPGYTTPNLVFSKVGAQGAVSIYNGGLAGTNLVADVQGWFPTGSSYTALTPARLVDTRPGRGTIDDTNAGEGALAAGGQLDVQGHGPRRCARERRRRGGSQCDRGQSDGCRLPYGLAKRRRPPIDRELQPQSGPHIAEPRHCQSRQRRQGVDLQRRPRPHSHRCRRAGLVRGRAIRHEAARAPARSGRPGMTGSTPVGPAEIERRAVLARRFFVLGKNANTMSTIHAG